MGHIDTKLQFDAELQTEKVMRQAADRKLFGRVGPLKRGLDMAISAVALLFLLPILALVAFAVKITSAGPIIYRQERLGLDGKIFHMYKFRTMYVDAQDKFDALLVSCPLSRAHWEKYQKLKNDPRITPVGHFLRKSSIDELPQLLNVLLGSMSIVGHRPLLPTQELMYGTVSFSHYIRSRPGITGLWQTSGRNELPFEMRATLDVEYSKNWSLGYDISLMLKTVPVVLFPNGAL